MRFSRECRLRASSEFVRLRRTGKWLPGRFFHLQVCERPEGETVSRLGLSVSRRVGSAVTRNRVKRRFRQIFREAASDFSTPVDVVVIARKGVDRVSYEDLRQQFQHAVRSWHRSSL